MENTEYTSIEDTDIDEIKEAIELDNSINTECVTIEEVEEVSAVITVNSIKVIIYPNQLDLSLIDFGKLYCLTMNYKNVEELITRLNTIKQYNRDIFINLCTYLKM